MAGRWAGAPNPTDLKLCAIELLRKAAQPPTPVCWVQNDVQFAHDRGSLHLWGLGGERNEALLDV